MPLYVDWLRSHPAAQAAPLAEQIAERLEGSWAELELALMPADVADDAERLARRRVDAARDGGTNWP